MVTSTMNPAASEALQACPADVREYLYKALDGGELTLEEGLRLATAEGQALNALIAVADHLRRETVGEAVTYVVNRNINFTNVCRGLQFLRIWTWPRRAGRLLALFRRSRAPRP